MDLQAFILSAAAIVVGLTAIGGLLKWLWKMTKRGGEIQDAWGPMEVVAKHFRDNGGSTLPELVKQILANQEAQGALIEELRGYALANRAANETVAANLEKSNLENQRTATALEVAVGIVRELASDDRQQLLEVTKATDRIERSAEDAASAAATVAARLKESQQRADAVHADEEPGTAADAASQSDQQRS